MRSDGPDLHRRRAPPRAMSERRPPSDSRGRVSGIARSRTRVKRGFVAGDPRGLARSAPSVHAAIRAGRTSPCRASPRGEWVVPYAPRGGGGRALQRIGISKGEGSERCVTSIHPKLALVPTRYRWDHGARATYERRDTRLLGTAKRPGAAIHVRDEFRNRATCIDLHWPDPVKHGFVAAPDRSFLNPTLPRLFSAWRHIAR